MRALALLLIALGPATAHPSELGREVFTTIAQPACALCHTLAAAGATGAVGPSLDELQPDRQRVIETVRGGIGVMPSFAGKLSEQEIEAVADFVSKAAGGQ